MLRFILSIAVFGTLSCSKDAPVSPPRAGKASAGDVASDRAVLEVFYKATGGDNWKDNTNWLSEKPLASWHGIYTTAGRVNSIELRDNNLTGYLPSELGQLTKLERLQLPGNQLTGAIPLELGRLNNLYLIDLARNQLTGSIPPELGQLTKLENLALRENPLTGCIPNALQSVSQTDYFPASDLDQLGILFCGKEEDQLDRAALIALYNATGGDDWESKTNWLTDAPLDKWHGVQVDAFGRVIAIDLIGNGLQGAIPPEIKELTALKELKLGHNQLTDVTEIGSLTSLIVLMLHYNQLGGEQLLGDDQLSFASLFDAFQGNDEEPSPSGGGSIQSGEPLA